MPSSWTGAALTDVIAPSLAVGRILVCSVERDGYGAPAPGERLRNGREPEVDRAADDGAPGVRRDAVAVAGDRHARPERNHGGIHGDDAPAGRDARRRRAVEGVARRAHRHL